MIEFVLRLRWKMRESRFQLTGCGQQHEANWIRRWNVKMKRRLFMGFARMQSARLRFDRRTLVQLTFPWVYFPFSVRRLFIASAGGERGFHRSCMRRVMDKHAEEFAVVFSPYVSPSSLVFEPVILPSAHGRWHRLWPNAGSSMSSQYLPIANDRGRPLF